MQYQQLQINSVQPLGVRARSQARERGFTIVELLIVIVVIGILAAITIVAYNGVQDRAHNTARNQEAHQLANLLQTYKATNGTYPNLPSGVNTVCIGGGYIDQNGDGLPDCIDANLSGAQHPDAGVDAALKQAGSFAPGDRTPALGYGDGDQRLGVAFSTPAGLGANGTDPTVLYWQNGTGSCGSDRVAWNGSNKVALCAIDMH